MKNRNAIKLVTLFVAVLMVFALSACGGTGNTEPPADTGPAESNEDTGSAPPPVTGETYRVIMANSASHPSQVTTFMRAFKERVEAESNGKIIVDLFEGGSFGTNNEILQALQNGSIQWAGFPIGFFTVIAPEVTIIDLPYLMDDPMQAFDVLNGDTPVLDAYLANQGLYAPSWMYESPKEISTLKTRIETVADMRGLKIRTYSSPVCQDVLTALGASPQSIPSPEVPTALQTGTLDGIESGISFHAPIRLSDYTKFYHKGFLGVANPIPSMFNKAFIDSLPDDIRKIIVDAAVELILGDIKVYAVQDDENNYKLYEEDDSVEIVIPSAALLAETRAAIEPVTTEYIGKSGEMKGIYEELKALADKMR